MQVFHEDGASDIPVGELMCIVVEEEEHIDAFKDYTSAKSDAQSEATSSEASVSSEDPSSSPEPTPPPSPALSTTSTAPTSTADRVLASPFARVTAAQAGLSLATVQGTGPGGRVLAADVTDAIASGAAVQAASATLPAMGAMPLYTDVDVTKFKKVTAERLVYSKQSIPHYYLTMECSVDEMLSLRAKINAKAKNGEYKLSVNDFVIKAAATALRRIPEVNAQWMGDRIRMFHAADISVAVQTNQGLITPIVKDADRKGLKEISEAVKELAAKAKDNALAPEEFMGGTFTISNLGMYSVNSFSAIVNPPQAAILAVGTSQKRVVPDSQAESGFATKTIMSVTLSCDHRVIDGAVGAQWLTEFRKCLEDPVEIIV